MSSTSNCSGEPMEATLHCTLGSFFEMLDFYIDSQYSFGFAIPWRIVT